MTWTLILGVWVALAPGGIIGSTTQFFVSRVASKERCIGLAREIQDSIPVGMGAVKITWSCTGPPKREGE